MRDRQRLHRLVLRSQAPWGELQPGQGVCIELLRPGRVLRERVYGSMHGLQPRDTGSLCFCSRQLLGSAGQVHLNNPDQPLWLHRQVRWRGLCLRFQGTKLQGL